MACNLIERVIDGVQVSFDIGYQDQAYGARPVGWYVQTLRGVLIAAGLPTRRDAESAIPLGDSRRMAP